MKPEIVYIILPVTEFFEYDWIATEIYKSLKEAQESLQESKDCNEIERSMGGECPDYEIKRIIT